MSKALTRYWAYDKCLKNRGVKYAWIDLQRVANKDLDDQGYLPIGKTQFFKDIKALKSPPWNAPIETYKAGGQSYYNYTDSNYSIRKQELTEVEAQQLKSALMVLGRFKGMPQFDWVHEIIPKIEQSFKLGVSQGTIIGFEQNVDLKGLEYLGVLFNTILFKKVIKVEYKSFSNDQIENHTIHPYFLKQYNNRWFLFGWNPKFSGLTNMALDRIEGLAELSMTYVENTTYDFDEYFEDIIGVTKPLGMNSETVRLWFAHKQAPYIMTKPLHGTQRKKSFDENGLIVTIDAIPNVELEQLILRHGENCKVLEPIELKLKILNRLNGAREQYSTR